MYINYLLKEMFCESEAVVSLIPQKQTFKQLSIIKILGCFFIARKGEIMFDKMFKDIADNLCEILAQFVANIPTGYVEADFEVQFLKIQIAFKNKAITYEEMIKLCDSLADNEKIWKKLNNKK